MKDERYVSKRSTWLNLASLAVTASLGTAHAATLVVKVTGIPTAEGRIGCALFADATGFPMDHAHARGQWQPASTDGAICRFEDVAPGRYAVSVFQDANGDGRLDTNLFDVPTEPWGVSNGVRPRLRAPRFDEAAFSLQAPPPETVIEVGVAR